jgi:diamine N-acetyltransferase
MMHEKIYIRLAAIADAETLSKLSAQTFYEAFAASNTKEDMEKHLLEYYSQEKLAMELADELVVFMLAYYNGELAGYVKVSEHARPEEEKELEAPIELERIYSLQQTIGKGVGSALMQAAIDYAKAKQKKTLWLGVFQQNELAISFYKKWGFEIYSEHIFVVGNDPQTDWLMKKALQ